MVMHPKVNNFLETDSQLGVTGVIMVMLCPGEVVDNELFAEPVTPAPAPAEPQENTARQYSYSFFTFSPCFCVDGKMALLYTVR